MMMTSGTGSARQTPLCPAGHLPLKGGDRLAGAVAPSRNDADEARHSRQLISPLEGEMPGKAEGGAKGRLPFQQATNPMGATPCAS